MPALTDNHNDQSGILYVPVCTACRLLAARPGIDANCKLFMENAESWGTGIWRSARNGSILERVKALCISSHCMLSSLMYLQDELKDLAAVLIWLQWRIQGAQGAHARYLWQTSHFQAAKIDSKCHQQNVQGGSMPPDPPRLRRFPPPFSEFWIRPCVCMVSRGISDSSLGGSIMIIVHDDLIRTKYCDGFSQQFCCDRNYFLKIEMCSCFPICNNSNL